MALIFSNVTVTSNGRSTSFLVGGSPENRSDLSNWTAFDAFVQETPLFETVEVSVSVHRYGGEEDYDATPEEVAYFMKRIEMQEDFIQDRTEKVKEYKFAFVI